MHDLSFVGDIPRNYDKGLGPVMFHGYADDLARRAAALEPATVLELAAGTGIVSRRLRDALPRASRLVVTDLSEPMLAVAREKFGPDETVEIAPADALALPFADESFDLVACQFGVMFFPDKVAAFREARRVLRPGGRYIFTCWASVDENPRALVTEDIFARFCGNAQNGAGQVPYGYCDPVKVRRDLAAGGFAGVTHETLRQSISVEDLQGFVRGVVYGSIRLHEVTRSGADPEALSATLIEEFRRRFGGDRVVMDQTAHLYDCRRD